MDGNEQAFMSNAVPVEAGSFQQTQQFNVNADKYQVNVYLVDAFNGNIYDSLWLANPVAPQPEPVPDTEPQPEPENPDEGEELPEPLPIPEDEPEVPVDPEEPVGDELKIEFESRSEWSSAVNTFNNGPLKTEGNNGGTTVGNTFDGAWLAYRQVDFGEKGKNRIAIEYDAPTSRAPEDSRLELRLGSVDGELIDTIELPRTGSGWGTYNTVEADLAATITGIQDLFIVMKGSTVSGLPYIGNFDRFTLDYNEVRNDYAGLELETYDAWSTDLHPANNGPMKTESVNNRVQVANTFDGAWLAFQRMDFGSEGVNQFAIEYAGKTANTAADAAVEVRLGGVDGKLVGTALTPPTASEWGTYKTVTVSLTETITGIQDLYLVLRGTTDSTFIYIGNFDNASFSFMEEPAEPDMKVEFESYSSWSTALNTFNNKGLKTEGKNGGTVVGNTFDGAWLAFNDVNFGVQGKNHVTIVYDAPTSRAPADVTAEIRLNSVDGEIIGTVPLPNTGSGWDTYKTASASLNQPISGQQTIYVVIKGSTTGSLLYVGNFDSMSFTKADE